MSVLTWGIDAAGAGQALPVLPLAYVIMATIRRRHLTWPVVIVCLVGVVLLDLQQVVDPALLMTAVASAVALVGLIGGRGDHRREVILQSVSLVIFSGLALIALYLAPAAAVYLLAAGWIGHGVWDVIHLRRNAVVSRSFAEWCAVVDLLIGVELLLIT
jgi:hypothetical protein